MARKSSVPDSVSKYRPCKCVRFRNDGNGIYRVYKYSAVKLTSGNWSSDYGYLIGKIIDGVGFFPNKRYLKELESEKRARFSDETTDLEYGNYALLQFLSQDVLEKLSSCFPAERAFQIYTYGLILCAHGFIYLDQIDEYSYEVTLCQEGN